MTLLERYEMLLKMNDKSLMNMIDQYNAGNLSPKTRLAMEMIDGCDGDGDRIAGAFQVGVAA